jgi:hypothetical protein
MGNKKNSLVIEIFSKLSVIRYDEIIPITDSPEKIGDIPVKIMNHQGKKLRTYIVLLKLLQFQNKKRIWNCGGISFKELRCAWFFHLEIQKYIDRASDILQKSIESGLAEKKYFKPEMRNGFKIVYAWNGPFSLN